MPDDKTYDLILRNVRLVVPRRATLEHSDVGVRNGKIATLARGLDPSQTRRVIDGRGHLAFPGVVDAHMHTGIYSPLAQDSVSESRAAAQGGVTSSLNYFRSGQYYLNKGGLYAELLPEVLDLTRGKFHVDYAFHLAPMDSRQIREIPQLIEQYGVTSFKIYMFYGGYGLHGASNSQHAFLMIDAHEKYDIAHFEFVMRGVQEAAQQYPRLREEISLSLHCETEIS